MSDNKFHLLTNLQGQDIFSWLSIWLTHWVIGHVALAVARVGE